MERIDVDLTALDGDGATLLPFRGKVGVIGFDAIAGLRIRLDGAGGDGDAGFALEGVIVARRFQRELLDGQVFGGVDRVIVIPGDDQGARPFELEVAFGVDRPFALGGIVDGLGRTEVMDLVAGVLLPFGGPLRTFFGVPLLDVLLSFRVPHQAFSGVPLPVALLPFGGLLQASSGVPLPDVLLPFGGLLQVFSGVPLPDAPLPFDVLPQLLLVFRFQALCFL